MSRSFYVGDAVSEEDIHAKYEDGILKLSVPKKAPKAVVRKRRLYRNRRLTFHCLFSLLYMAGIRKGPGFFVLYSRFCMYQCCLIYVRFCAKMISRK